MNRRMAVGTVMAFVFIFTAAPAQAESIGLNFDGGWGSGPYPLGAGDNTGAVAQVNWDNQMTGAAQNAQWWTSPALHDNANAATTLTITVGNPTQSQLQDDGPGPGDNSGGIQTLFYGQIRCNTDGGPCHVSSSGMPYASYDLYVYTNAGITLTAGGGTGSTSISGFGIGSGYVEGQNYVKLTGMSGDFAFDDGSAIYAIQVVKAGAPLAPNFTATPDSGLIAFGNVGVSTTATQTVTLNNIGTAAGNVTSASVTGDFIFSSVPGTPTYSVAASGAAPYDIQLPAQTLPGAYSGTATIVTQTGTFNYTLSATVIAHDGDVNGDGQVSLLDYNIIKVNFGNLYESGNHWGDGDVNGDLQVGLLDFNIVKAHFGHTTGDVGVTAVPEPATLSLLALAGLAALRRKR